MGVDYECGSQSGTTSKDGKFTFEVGKDCKFSLAGIELKNIHKDQLADGKKVVENNASVASLLQSLDADGNASNGIEITLKIKKAFEEQIKKQQTKIKTLTQLVERLEDQINSLKQQLADQNITMKYVTPKKAMEHARGTKMKVMKDLIGGKSVYFVAWNSLYEGLLAARFTFDENLSNVKIEQVIDWKDNFIPKGSFSIRYIPATDEILYEDQILVMKNYNSKKITLENKETHDEVMFFFSIDDAEDYANKLKKDNTDSSNKNSDDVNSSSEDIDINSHGTSNDDNHSDGISKYIVGKTYYRIVLYAPPSHIITIKYNSNGKTFTASYPNESGGKREFTGSYNIMDDDILEVEGEEPYFAPIYETDEYIQFFADDRKLYKSYEIAKKYAN